MLSKKKGLDECSRRIRTDLSSQYVCLHSQSSKYWIGIIHVVFYCLQMMCVQDCDMILLALDERGFNSLSHINSYMNQYSSVFRY